MLKLEEFDKVFYNYDMIDEEAMLLEEDLLEEAKLANKNVKRQLEILRKTNTELLSLSENDEAKRKELVRKFNDTMEEFRDSHLMLGLIKIGLYELTYMRFDHKNENEITYQ